MIKLYIYTPKLYSLKFRSSQGLVFNSDHINVIVINLEKKLCLYSHLDQGKQSLI